MNNSICPGDMIIWYPEAYIHDWTPQDPRTIELVIRVDGATVWLIEIAGRDEVAMGGTAMLEMESASLESVLSNEKIGAVQIIRAKR